MLQTVIWQMDESSGCRVMPPYSTAICESEQVSGSHCFMERDAWGRLTCTYIVYRYIFSTNCLYLHTIYLHRYVPSYIYVCVRLCNARQMPNNKEHTLNVKNECPSFICRRNELLSIFLYLLFNEFFINYSILCKTYRHYTLHSCV